MPNKYARIDKYCRKSEVYLALYLVHENTPGQIAKKFGVTTKSVVNALRKEQSNKRFTPNYLSCWQRAKQLAWSYLS